jgi:hypothetical protein
MFSRNSFPAGKALYTAALRRDGIDGKKLFVVFFWKEAAKVRKGSARV